MASKTMSCAYSCWRLSSCGMLRRQGPHHVAQKSSNTILPRRSDSETSLPSSDVSRKPGASCPTSTPVWRVEHLTSVIAKARQQTTHISFLYTVLILRDRQRWPYHRHNYS